VSREDRARWEAKYAGGAHPEREPEPFVLEMLAAAPAGAALDVACGRGRHAIALARAGYAVDAVDVAPAALASARERAGGLPIRWIEADLDAWEPPRDHYALVVCVDFSDGALAPRLVAALRPGGVLVYAGRPRARCRYGPEPGAVARWFAALETLAHREDEDRVCFAGRRGATSGPA